MASNSNHKPLHIVMFPWLAFGHLIPFLDLSKLLAQRGHRISFLSTPRNIDRLPKIPPSLSPSISLIKIPLPKSPNLPENAEATMDIHGDQVPYLKKAFDTLEPGLTRFLEGSDPDWIIFDFLVHWLPDIATRLGISSAYFSIINAWFLCFLGHSDDLINGSDYRTRFEDFMGPPKWVKFECSLGYRKFQAKWLKSAYVKDDDDDSNILDSYRMGKVFNGCDAIFVRQCYEFEPNWLTLLEELHRKPVIPVGLMPPILDRANDVKIEGEGEVWISIGRWLDGWDKGCVVYVALGSEVTLSQSQLDELALGLELSGVPFFWVLRKASESDSMELPSGFEERVRDRGLVWRKWAPQLKILSHDSVGGFLTHCGWSSIIEGLMFGRPLITLPFLVDQGLNSRVIVEKQVGVEIPRNDEDGSYTRDSVDESIKIVMVGDDGKKFEYNAKEMSKLFSDMELQCKYENDFVEFLETHRNLK